MGFLFEIVRLGLKNLRLHMLRSVLTSLGIILGVAAVIIMVSIGEGNKQAALRDIQSLGATNIIIRSSKPTESGNFSGGTMATIVKYGILDADLRRLERNFPDAVSIVPLKTVGDEISYQDQREISQAFGTTPDLLRVTSLQIERGRYLTREDMEKQAPVAVLGAEVAEKFFRMRDPLGATFRISDKVFTVVGVLRPVGLAGGTGSALVGRDLNKDVHIPLTTSRTQFSNIIMRRVAGSFSGEEIEISEIYLTADSTETVLVTAERVRRLMQLDHPGLNDIQLIVPWELLENAKRTALIWNIVLTFIASISLLVGGIGIMNIMLASVTERTREIGIRRALGATRKHIILQFLVETGALSAVGGVIGVIVGVGVSIAIGTLLPELLKLPFLRGFVSGDLQLETQVTTWSIVASFIVATMVGLVFGIYPAIVASRKDPIVALRHD